jgi:hypothetical protein
MRRWLMPLAVLPALTFPTHAVAAGSPGGAVAPSGGSSADAKAAPSGGGSGSARTTAPAATGGSAFRAGPLLVARSFSVAPRTVVPGARLTVRWRVDGRAERARLRVVLRPTAAPPVSATSGVFPVRGPYSFGGSGAPKL